MQTVLHQITGYSISESVEEVCTNTDESKVNPGLILEQVSKRLERELFCTYRF
jgi:hypothetical protein